MTTKELTYDDLNVRMQDIYEIMGYGDNTPDDDVRQEVDAMLADIRQWLRPRMAFFVVRGTHDETERTLTVPGQEGTFSIGKIISNQLRGSVAYAFFVCTAGTEYQEYMERTMATGDMVKAYNAHSIGSILVEACADRMEEVLQMQIDKLGWKRTNRFSPGYCGWHVREQHQFFPLFNGVTVGVTLTPSALMMPIKSVSGVIGLGPDVRYNPYTCGLCDYKKCYKRRKKEAAK